MQALSICVSLLESGVNPEALAAVVKELRREVGYDATCCTLDLCVESCQRYAAVNGSLGLL
jgi:hypothetical protein